MEVKVESLLGQNEQQTKEDYKNYAVTKLKKKFVSSLLEAGLSYDKIKDISRDASIQGYNSVLALPAYIAHITNCILDKGTNVGVVINYPFGENTLESTQIEIKKWVKSIVDEIVVVLSLSDLKYNKCKRSEKILKVLGGYAKKKKVSVMVDTCKLNELELERLVKIISESKINCVYISTAIYKECVDEKILHTFKIVRKNNISVCCLGEVNDCQTVVSFLGDCDLFVTDKATKFIDEIKSNIQI